MHLLWWPSLGRLIRTLVNPNGVGTDRGSCVHEPDHCGNRPRLCLGVADGVGGIRCRCHAEFWVCGQKRKWRTLCTSALLEYPPDRRRPTLDDLVTSGGLNKLRSWQGARGWLFTLRPQSGLSWCTVPISMKGLQRLGGCLQRHLSAYILGVACSIFISRLHTEISRNGGPHGYPASDPRPPPTKLLPWKMPRCCSISNIRC